MDSAPLNRFAADWKAIWPEGKPVGLAVSGGADSLALLLLASEALHGACKVATVDHGLRRSSAAEAAYVASLCAERGIDHAVLTLGLASGPALQERARKARYAALADWANNHGLTGIVTAHHADDQAETVLMRLARGAGVRGLASMRARSSLSGTANITLLRPLLRWRKAELAAVVESAHLAPVMDPSNFDPKFERARMRANLNLLPDLDAIAVSSSASHLAEADASIEWAAERCLRTVTFAADVLYWDPEDTPRVISIRVLEGIVVRLGGGCPRGAALVRWLERLQGGGVATLAGIQGDGRRIPWRFVKAPSPRGNSIRRHRGQ